jgi:hypothetical protein
MAFLIATPKISCKLHFKCDSVLNLFLFNSEIHSFRHLKIPIWFIELEVLTTILLNKSKPIRFSMSLKPLKTQGFMVAKMKKPINHIVENIIQMTPNFVSLGS